LEIAISLALQALQQAIEASSKAAASEDEVADKMAKDASGSLKLRLASLF
jgi:hypothetical protein